MMMGQHYCDPRDDRDQEAEDEARAHAHALDSEEADAAAGSDVDHAESATQDVDKLLSTLEAAQAMARPPHWLRGAIDEARQARDAMVHQVEATSRACAEVGAYRACQAAEHAYDMAHLGGVAGWGRGDVLDHITRREEAGRLALGAYMEAYGLSAGVTE